MNDLPAAIDQLNGRMEALERRVGELEQTLAARRERTAPLAGTPPGTLEAALLSERPAAQTGGMFSVLGKAMLGIAGAYLLRAVAEGSVVPRPLAAILGIAYSIVWLLIAARTRAEARFARAVYAVNSAVILAPMLWELAVRFKALPASAIAGALMAYELTALLLGTRLQRTVVPQIATVTVAALCLTLAIVTHETLPFAAVLMATAALCEYRAATDMGRLARLMVALTADLAVWLLIYIYTNPAEARSDYPALGRVWLLTPAILLFLLYASATALNALRKELKVIVFETAQATIAFLLAAVALLEFGPESKRMILGVACLALAAACYGATAVLLKHGAQRRNVAVFSTWSGALLVAGSFLSIAEPWTAAWLCAPALAGVAAGAHFRRVFLEFHGAVFLFAAAFAAGFAEFLGRTLSSPQAGAPGGMVYAVTACAALCYVASGREGQGEWEHDVLRLVFAALAVGAVTALLAQGLTRLVALGMVPALHHMAFIRMLTLCAVSLALVFSGARLHRRELGWLGYATIAAAVVKLFAEDLRHGHLEYVAASIFLLALTLIAAPRVARSQ